MNFAKTSLPVALLVAAVASTGCSFNPKPNPEQKQVLNAKWVNPHPPGTYEYFRSEPSYPKTYNVYRDDSVLAQTNANNARVKIDLRAQRAILYKDENIAMDYPIASGTSGFPTPPRNNKIVEKIRSAKRSNHYRTIYDAEGKVHKSNAEISKDGVPEGGSFKGAAMPYWMRLTWSGLGMHQGNVPRYPASHGCVRIPSKVASTVYSKTDIGTPVSIVR
jgi:lipoprotein-anchoring transpeptidase ErfK/SrfK